MRIQQLTQHRNFRFPTESLPTSSRTNPVLLFLRTETRSACIRSLFFSLKSYKQWKPTSDIIMINRLWLSYFQSCTTMFLELTGSSHGAMHLLYSLRRLKKKSFYVIFNTYLQKVLCTLKPIALYSFKEITQLQEVKLTLMWYLTWPA